MRGDRHIWEMSASLPSGEGHTCSPKLGVPYELLHFHRVGKLVQRFRVPLHGWEDDDIDTPKT